MRIMGIDWTKPLIRAAADFLREQRERELSGGAIVVLPSGRALMRLKELLGAESQPEAWRGFHFLGVAALSSRLIDWPKDQKVASEFEQTLAWTRVLIEADSESLKLLVPTVPAATAVASWLELGGLLRRLHATLAASAMTFDSVLKLAVGETEMRRWRWLCDCENAVLSQLASAELVDPSSMALQTLRDGSSCCNRPIVLVGTTDLSDLLRGLLRTLKSPVIAMAACPGGDLTGFDRLGTLDAEHWREHRLQLDLSQLVPAGGMADQANVIAQTVREFEKQHSIGEITIGVTDESQVDPIEVECHLESIATYRHLGTSLSETSVGRLIDLMVEFAQRRHWSSLAALVRHADVHAMVSRTIQTPNWLTQLDTFMAEAFPQLIDGEIPKKHQRSCVAAVRDCVKLWMSPLDGSRRPIGLWSDVVKQMLAQLYSEKLSKNSGSLRPASGRCAGGEGISTEDEQIVAPEPTRTSRAITATVRLLDNFSDLNESLDLPTDGPLALELLATRITEARLADDWSSDKVEILGWLDLVLDDAESMIVCGLNQPYVPESLPGDPFLPVALRRLLSQSGNDRRYARDVHALGQMLAMRSDIRLLVGSHGADGSPTPPSRLLGAGTAEESARRLIHVLNPSESTNQVDAPETLSNSIVFQPPPVESGRTLNVMSVTAFSAYLTCPYRFYLRHVLGLKPLDDSAGELAANQFGDLVHGALERFGMSTSKDESHAEQIYRSLVEHLHSYALDAYGENTSPAVRLQVRQAERRLRCVAERQAERIAQGWRIHAVEASVDERDVDRRTGQPKKPTQIVVDGRAMGLKGRFDRIDVHPATGRWAILDYKTHGHPPEKKHLKRVSDGSWQWIDLQLPLYRRVIADLGIPVDSSQVELGYFNISEKDSETKVNIAQFSTDQLTLADELIESIVRNVLNGQFEPTTNTVQYDDYEFLMNQRGTALMDEEIEDEEVLA